jgi:hypothetical protein
MKIPRTEAVDIRNDCEALFASSSTRLRQAAFSLPVYEYLGIKVNM